MQENNINSWQNLNDEDFIYVARHLKFDTLSRLDRDYIGSRLQDLGYEIDYGCCGRNILRSIPR